MLSLRSDHITNVYCVLDDLITKSPPNPLGGRPPILSDSEVLTMLVWNTLVLHQKTIKELHTWVGIYHRPEFPSLPKYEAFVKHCHRVLPQCLTLLEQLLSVHEPLRFVDSTMLPVCRLHRAKTHRVAKAVARFGKNHQGWHYGFKLHASVDAHGKLCGIALTPANVHDAQALRFITNMHTKIAVGDGAYTASVMQKILWERYGMIVVSPPHPKQTKKVLTWWQQLLLNARSKIESVFDILKEHLHLVTSFPRSVHGYLFHYVRILLAYQMSRV